MKRLLVTLAIVVVLIFGCIAAFLATLDVNQYRDSIAQELSDRTGRKISLYGVITLGLSSDGLKLTVLDAAVGNPPWASRKIMANIGRFDLGVSMWPLLHRRIVITRLDIAGADIDLEAESGNRDNWDFSTANSAADASSPGSEPVVIHVRKFSILNSQVTFYDRDGNATVYKIDTMSVSSGDKTATVNLQAKYNGTPIVLKLKTGTDDLLPPRGAWPFSAALGYANYVFTLQGNADIDAKRAAIARYELSSGSSTLDGKLDVDWSEEVPRLKGTLNGDTVTVADFVLSSSPPDPPTQPDDKSASAGPGWLFNDTILPFDTLKAVNADIDFKIAQINLADASLTQVAGQLNVTDGVLVLMPFSAGLGGGTVKGQMGINTVESPPHSSLLLTAADVGLDELFHLMSLPGVTSGKANVDINVTTTGNTTNTMAGNALGVVNLVAAGGNVSGFLHDVSSVLMDMFVPGGRNDLNCLVARFTLKNGIAQDNGLLADTSAMTVAGSGSLNLLQETIGITLRARTKGINVGAIFPSATVDGTFLSPHVSVNPAEVVQNVTGLMASGGATDVPTIESHPGENACLYTLDHPLAPPSSSAGGVLENILPPTLSNSGLTGKATDALRNVGGALKGLLGQ